MSHRIICWMALAVGLLPRLMAQPVVTSVDHTAFCGGGTMMLHFNPIGLDPEHLDIEAQVGDDPWFTDPQFIGQTSNSTEPWFLYGRSLDRGRTNVVRSTPTEWVLDLSACAQGLYLLKVNGEDLQTSIRISR